MQKVYFRGDGSPEIGLGHIVRLCSFASKIKDEFTTCFISSQKNKTVEEMTLNYFEEMIWLSAEENEIIQLKKQLPSSCIIVIDSYDLSAEYQKTLREAGFKIIYIDDLCKSYQAANVVINTGTENKAKYLGINESNLFLGLDYTLLRPDFNSSQGPKKSITAPVKALVSFGGADPFNFTSFMVEALKKNDKIDQIHLLLGGLFPFQDILEPLIRDTKAEVIIHKSLNSLEVKELMGRCDFMICSCSNIAVEAASQCLPVITAPVVDNQEELFHLLSEKKLVMELKGLKEKKIKQVKEELKTILEPSILENSSRQQSIHLEVENATRYISIVKTLIENTSTYLE